MNKHIRIRRDVASNWTQYNPVLRQGEVGYVIDEFVDQDGVRYYVTKIGDGESAWEDLPRAAFCPVPSGGGGGGSVAWADITGKPSTFAPSAHTHPWSEVTDKPSSFTPSAHTHAWDAITDKPSTFTPSDHGHAIDDITGLEAALDDKASRDFVVDGLATKAEASHGHEISDVTGLQTALDGKAATSHTHIIANVTGLQSALDGKAASSHSHAISDVSGLQTALDGKMDATKRPPIITAPQSNLTAGLIRYQNVGASGTPLSSSGTADGTVPHALTVYRMRARVVIASPVAGSAATIQLVVSGSVVATITIPVGAAVTATYEATILTPIAVADNATWYMQYNAPSGSAIQINNVTLSVL